MVTYSTNWMGPISKAWCDEHGSDWAGGRIDIRGVPDEPWGLEYGLPIMKSRDWTLLSDWLRELKTEEVWPYHTIIEEFECTYGEITWWREG